MSPAPTSSARRPPPGPTILRSDPRDRSTLVVSQAARALSSRPSLASAPLVAGH